MTTETIHTCSYECERPGCIRAQRDELAARLTAAMSQPAEAQAQGGGEVVAWRVPVLQSPFGERLDHGIRDGLVLVMHRGMHGWKAAGQGHALFAHQIYVKNVEPLCAISHEIAVVGLHSGDWRTVWARFDDVTHPAPQSAPVGVDAPGSRAWMAEVCRAAALSLAAHGVHNDQLSKVADWIDQQPAAVCICPHQDAREPYHDVACPAHIAQQPAAVDGVKCPWDEVSSCVDPGPAGMVYPTKPAPRASGYLDSSGVEWNAWDAWQMEAYARAAYSDGWEAGCREALAAQHQEPKS